MPNETLSVTDRGIGVIARADTDINSLDVHIIIALIGEPLNMFDLTTRIRTTSKERRLIDVKYVAASVSKLIRRGVLVYSGPIRMQRKYRRMAQHAK